VAAAPRRFEVPALMELDLETMSPWREHVMNFLACEVQEFCKRLSAAPADWQQMPEPENPFRGRKPAD